MPIGRDILEKAHQRLLDEYGRRGLAPGLAAKFALHPAWNAVIGSDGSCGVAMSFRGNNPNYGDSETFFQAGELKPYVGATLFEVARRNLADGRLRTRSVALAALNALTRPFVDEAVLREKGFASVASLDGLVGKDDVVAVVGYGGLVREYQGRCRELHVTDMRPPAAFTTTVIGESVEHGPRGVFVHPEEDNAAVLASADVVLITGSTLANGTFDEVVRHAAGARIRCLYGSSAQLLPDVLFESGINIVMSVAVDDAARFERDVLDESDMETALKRHQRKYTASVPGFGHEARRG